MVSTCSFHVEEFSEISDLLHGRSNSRMESELKIELIEKNESGVG